MLARLNKRKKSNSTDGDDKLEAKPQVSSKSVSPPSGVAVPALAIPSPVAAPSSEHASKYNTRLHSDIPIGSL